MASEKAAATGLAGRYATALFELAEAGGDLDKVAEDLASLRAMIDESAELRHVLRSPVISRGDQARAVLALAESAGCGELTRKFLGLVAQKRRLAALPRIIRAYQALLAAKRGEITAKVVSAKKLTAQQGATLEAVLKEAIGADVAVDARVDPALLGGLVVKVGSRMVDSSLRTKLEQLRLAMKGVA